MKVELPKLDDDKLVSPHAQEIEYALILQRMINSVEEDPAQMRLAIYEFARTRLRLDSSSAEDADQQRLSTALETAIQGVEQFSLRRDEKERLQSASSPLQIAQPTATAVARLRPIAPAAEDIIVPQRPYPGPEIRIVEVRDHGRLSMLARLCVALVIFSAIAGLAYYRRHLSWMAEFAGSASKSRVVTTSAATLPIAPKPPAPEFPLPSDYGIYALNSNALSELYPLPVRVPDKRIAMSTPVSQPSRTILDSGKVKFILFRRELVGRAPERVDVRVVARVVRALTFDASGKPSLTAVSDAWNIRNISYEFRVRPIAGNPEMLLVQSEKPDFALPPGRYILVLGEQGYDFTVAGKITDLSQCLERTDAANGSFYSECRQYENARDTVPEETPKKRGALWLPKK